MIKFYAKQVDWENQESWLFYHYKNPKTNKTELVFEDDYFNNETIIYGNKDYMGITTDEFDRIMRIDEEFDEVERLLGIENAKPHYYDNLTQFVNYNYPKSNGKKYNTREIHAWKQLFIKYSQSWREEDIVLEALKLMTDKTWREISLRGCSQGDWQEGYVSDRVSDSMVRYLEICYFNTGVEYRVYESKEDFENQEDGYSIYVDSWNSEEALIEALGCKEDEIEIYNFTGYHKVADYERVR